VNIALPIIQQQLSIGSFHIISTVLGNLVENISMLCRMREGVSREYVRPKLSTYEPTNLGLEYFVEMQRKGVL
jgi:hypothetical protein